MNIVDQLRPEAPELDPEWSAGVLRQIMATPRPRRRRTRSRTGLIVAGAVTAAVAGGGVAVAAGVTPPWVDRKVHELSAANHGRWGDVDMVEFAKFRTPSGREFELWGGTNAAGGKCLAGTYDRHGQGLPSNYFVGCGPAGGLALNTFVHDEGTIVYGVSPAASATSVEFHHGGEVLGVLPVDPDTHGWGGGLPRARGVDHLTVVYKNADGVVVGTEHLTAAE
jgi:hypothetical protein